MENKRHPPTVGELEKLLAEVEALANRASEYEAPLAGLLFTILACYGDEHILQKLIDFSFNLMLSSLKMPKGK